MWRILLLTAVLAGVSTAARALEPAWQVCASVSVANPPILSDCRPVADFIDPQGRQLWLRAAVPAPTDGQPRALYLVGTAASTAWLNGVRLGANGRPGASAQAEAPGRYQATLPIRETAWRAGENEVVIHMSAFHGPLRLARPIAAATVDLYPYPSRSPYLAVVFLAAGALFAAAFGFGLIHLLRRTGSSLILAIMAGVAGLQAIVESLRSLVAYAYPLHVWRIGTIWVLAAVFSVLLAAYVATRFLPRMRGRLTALAAAAVSATALAPGFDMKTGWALILGVVIAAGVAAAGAMRRAPGAGLTLAYLALFMALGIGFPEWLADLSYFLLAAGLLLPLLMAEMVRLGRDAQGREAALTRAASRPDRLTVTSARGVELVPVADIVAVVGADDYAELWLVGERRLLHAARLDRLEAELPPEFLRIHRSAIANLAHAERLIGMGGRWRLQMRGGATLPVSRSRLPILRRRMGASSGTASEPGGRPA
jgi:DNA-binding LytR/AlgR family response regulator